MLWKYTPFIHNNHRFHLQETLRKLKDSPVLFLRSGCSFSMPLHGREHPKTHSTCANQPCSPLAFGLHAKRFFTNMKQFFLKNPPHPLTLQIIIVVDQSSVSIFEFKPSMKQLHKKAFMSFSSGISHSNNCQGILWISSHCLSKR